MKLTLTTLVAFLFASTAFASPTYDPQAAGETCEMVQVMSEKTPGKVLYSYRADPSCGNVRTGKTVIIGAAAIKDKNENIIGSRFVREVLNDN